MASATSKPTPVSLTYSVGSKGEIQFTPKKLNLKIGELVAFTCDQGKLKLLLEPPDAWDPPGINTGQAVKVMKPRGKIWCGGTFQLKGSGPRSQHNEVTIDPNDKEYGSQNGTGGPV